MKINVDTLMLALQATACWLWFKESRAARKRVRELDEMAGEVNAMRRMAEEVLAKASKGPF